MLMNHTRTVKAGCGVLAVSALCCAAPAEPVHFRAWFEGPGEVLAGEAATFDLWVGATGAELEDAMPDALATLVLSLRVAGDLNALDSLDTALPGVDSVFLTSAGTPDGAVLRDVAGMQNILFPPPFPSHDNPLRVLRFGVLTAAGSAGDLSMVLEDGLAWGPLRFVWYVNTSLVASDGPGNSLAIDPFSFRVIPAPSGVVLLGLGCVAGQSSRRRRTG